MSAAERREQILDVAWEICRLEGFSAVSMERLAQGAGITRTVIYQQFGDLEAVLLALVKRQYDKGIKVFLEAVTRASESDGNPLLAIFAELLKAVDDDPDNWAILLKTPAGAPAALYEQLDAGRAITRSVLARSLELHQSAEGAVDTELNTHVMQIIAEELLRLRLEAPESYSHARLMEQVRVMTRDW